MTLGSIRRDFGHGVNEHREISHKSRANHGLGLIAEGTEFSMKWNPPDVISIIYESLLSILGAQPAYGGFWTGPTL